MAVFDEDFVAPERQKLSDAETYVKQWKFLKIVNGFVLLYNLAHKLVMPLLMQWARSTSFHHLDWWWTYHLVFAVLLLRKKWDDHWLRFLVHFGFGGLLLQLVVSVKEYNWHIVSFWVTALATLAVLLHALSISRHRSSWRREGVLLGTGWALGLLVQWVFMGMTLDLDADKVLRDRLERVKVVPVDLQSTDQCGVNGYKFSVQERLFGPQNFGVLTSGLKISEKQELGGCGFQPALGLYRPGGSTVFTNGGTSYVNVKVMVLDRNRWKIQSNLPLPQGARQEVSWDRDGQKIYLLYSDAAQGKGVSLLIPSFEVLQNHVRDLYKDHLDLQKPQFLVVDRVLLGLE